MAGRLEFVEQNVVKKSGGDYDFPKLKLTKGEVARIILLENPAYAYVHNIQHPVLDEGVPVFETRSRKDGTEYKVNKTAFVSRPICLGDEGVLAEKGIDPKGCPVCAYAEANPDRMEAPKRRFALHVVQYATKKSGDLATPFRVDVKVWAFTDRVFNEIVALRKEWGDLTKRDIVLTCENEAFQNYKISIGADAQYLQDPKREAVVAETFVPENQTPDLTIFCGRATEERYIKADLVKVNSFWQQIDRLKGGGQVESTGTGATLDGAIDKLLNSGADEKPAVEAAESVEDLFPGAAAEPAASGDVEDFDNILASL